MRDARKLRSTTCWAPMRRARVSMIHGPAYGTDTAANTARLRTVRGVGTERANGRAGETRTSARTRSGYRAATRTAIEPPIELPTRKAGPCARRYEATK